MGGSSSASLHRFNELWGRSADVRPLFIAIGGAAGVGKSHLAAQLCQRIPALTTICTSLIQIVLRATQPHNALLGSHTYDLESIEDYVARCRPIMACINQLMRFAPSERQLYVVEGSSVIPGHLSPTDQVSAVEIYVRVSDPETHRRMLGGPTHDRTLAEIQFRRCRLIQDFIAAEAAKLGQPVVEFDRALVTALELIEETLAAQG